LVQPGDGQKAQPVESNAASRGVATPASPTETVQQKLARLERENAALRKEVDDLKLDKVILKKAAAFFVKEST
jgi:hypothetical protein